MYRAVALYFIERGLIKDGKIPAGLIADSLNHITITFKHNEKSKSSETYLNGENVEGKIRDPKISRVVSGVSTIKDVRDKLSVLQKNMGSEKGVVMDGRDIGTAILPHAELKLFLTSDIDVRTKRRYDELIAKGYDTTEMEVKKNLLDRDYQDTHRKENPLGKADDAIEIDNSELTLDELLTVIKEEVDKKLIPSSAKL